jgi:integrase
MSILAECPYCHKKQSTKNRKCGCGADLVKEKRARKVRYWINFRLPDGKQRRESVGFSIEDAQAADGKRKSQKKENRIFDMLPESKMTFSELADWYLGLESVKRVKAYDRVQISLKNFNREFGCVMVGSIKQVDVEEYQAKRVKAGRAFATVDMEVSTVNTMVTKAFDNDMVDGRALKAFRKVKRLLKAGDNARDRVISVEEYVRLVGVAHFRLRNFIVIAYNTGMRSGEIRTLRWSYVDQKNGFIRLPADVTKEGKKKSIPINHNVRRVLKSIPRSLSHEYLFDFKGRPVLQRNANIKSFENACKKAGIPYGRKTADGVTIHDLRRSVKTHMLEAGLDKAHRDMILGHSLHGMDVHYLVPTEESLRNAMDRYTEWLDGEVSKVRVDRIKEVL